MLSLTPHRATLLLSLPEIFFAVDVCIERVMYYEALNNAGAAKHRHPERQRDVDRPAGRRDVGLPQPLDPNARGLAILDSLAMPSEPVLPSSGVGAFRASGLTISN